MSCRASGNIIVRNTIFTAVLVTGLAGCSSDDTSYNDPISAIQPAELNGNWTRCVQTGSDSSQRRDMSLNNGSGEMTVYNYSGTGCNTPTGAFFGPDGFSYTLGGDFNVNGEVAGITVATAIDITTDSRKTYEAVAITDRFTSSKRLYVSDEAASATDGNSPDQRFDALDPVPYEPF